MKKTIVISAVLFAALLAVVPAASAQEPYKLPPKEVIAIVDRRARLNVEVKAPQEDWPVLSRRLIEVLRSHQLLSSTIISCFEPGALVAVREQAEDARLGLLWQQTGFADAWRWAHDLGAVSIHPHWMLVSPDIVRAAHDRGLQILTWTVNDVGVMRDLVREEVDGIISDFPEHFRAWQHESAP